MHDPLLYWMRRFIELRFSDPFYYFLIFVRRNPPRNYNYIVNGILMVFFSKMLNLWKVLRVSSKNFYKPNRKVRKQGIVFTHFFNTLVRFISNRDLFLINSVKLHELHFWWISKKNSPLTIFGVQKNSFCTLNIGIFKGRLKIQEARVDFSPFRHGPNAFNFSLLNNEIIAQIWY